MIRIPVGSPGGDAVPECIMLTNEIATNEPVPPPGALRAEKGFNAGYYEFSRMLPEHLEQHVSSEAFGRIMGSLNELIRWFVDRRTRLAIETVNEAFRGAGMGNIISMGPGHDQPGERQPRAQPGLAHDHAQHASDAGLHGGPSGGGDGAGGGEGPQLNLNLGAFVGNMMLFPMLMTGFTLGISLLGAGMGNGNAALTWVGALVLLATVGLYVRSKCQRARRGGEGGADEYLPIAGGGSRGAGRGAPAMPNPFSIMSYTQQRMNAGFERARREQERQLQLRAEFGAQVRAVLQRAAAEVPGTFWQAHDQLATVVRTHTTGTAPHTTRHHTTHRVSWPYLVVVSKEGAAGEEDPLLNAPSLSMVWPHDQQRRQQQQQQAPAPMDPTSYGDGYAGSQAQGGHPYDPAFAAYAPPTAPPSEGADAGAEYGKGHGNN